MTTQLISNKCDGGLICSPPKECCKQGCCFVLAPTYTRPSAVQSGSMLVNPLFLGHWYFWLAVAAAIVGILCACTLWRKHSQGGFCCRNSSNRNRTCSEPDSIGSCYAPPQYSSCNNFLAPPPPYSEVTSKPDMYPLVISYNNTEPAIKLNNNNSARFFIQSFRDFFRPNGSISATSTNDSISSSFLCNATSDTNNLVPPTYSNVASLEELALNPSIHPSPSNSERRMPRSVSSASSATTEYHQVLQQSPSVTLSTTQRADFATAASVVLPPSLAVQSTSNKPMTCASKSDRCNENIREAKLVKLPSTTTASPTSTRERPTAKRTRRPPPQRSQDSTEDEELFSALLNLSICMPNSAEPTHPQTTTMLQDLHFGVTNSMTGSDISSLANLEHSVGTPDSPPRATSPTVEMRELLDKIQQLPVQKSPNATTASTSNQAKSYFHKVRAKTMYMPLGEVQTVNSGKGHNNKSTMPYVFSKNWLSRSAPCTPCGALAPSFPSGRGSQKGSKTRLNDASPLLKQHAEESEDDPNPDVCL